MDGDGRLDAARAAAVAPFVYSGVGILKPELFDAVEDDVFRARAVLLLRRRTKAGCSALRLDGLWLHVGRPETIAEAERAIERSVL